MTREIYIFGSTTRGEVAATSDVDVLVIPDKNSNDFYPSTWSVYSKETIESYFSKGRLFAWHLYLEAVRIYPRSGTGFLAELGAPAPYLSIVDDLEDLTFLLQSTLLELRQNSPSQIYELGLAYTAIRDIAMAASSVMLPRPSFSRYAPYELPVPCPLPLEVYEIAMKSRHASTRGTPEPINFSQASNYLKTTSILDWVEWVRSESCRTHS